jgi:hypothetical protein
MSVDIVARLKLRGEEFSRGIKTAFNEVGRDADVAGRDVGKRFGSGFNSGLGSLVGAATLTAIGALADRALANISALKTTSAQLNVTTKDLQEYGYAAKAVGVEQADLNNALGDLTEKIGAARLGNKEAIDTFKKLGVDVTTLKGRAKDTGEVMGELVGRISSVTDPAKRAAIESKLLGESWQKIDPLLASGADRVNGLRNAAQDLGIVLSDKQIQEADQTAKKLEQVKMVLEANIASVVANNATAIAGLANSLTTLSSGLSNFWSQDPKGAMAVLGALAGARLGAAGGLPGIALGAGIGAFAGYELGPEPARNLTNVKARLGDAKERLSDLTTPQRYGRTAQLVAPSVNPRELAIAKANVLALQKEYDGLLAKQKAVQQAVKPLALPKASPLDVDLSTPAKARKVGMTDAEREAKRLLDQYNQISKSLDGQVQKQEDIEQVERVRVQQGELAARQEEALLAIKRQFPALENTTADILAKQYGVSKEKAAADLSSYETLKKTAELNVKNDYDAEQEKAAGALIQKAMAELDKAQQERLEREKRQVEDLASFYMDAFSGRTGDIWKDFKRQGMATISYIAAQYTLALLSGKSLDLSSAIGAASGAVGQSPLGALLGSIGGGLFGKSSGGSAASAMSGSWSGAGSIVAGDDVLTKAGLGGAGAAGGLGGIGGAISSVAGPLALASVANSLIGDIFGFKGGPLGILTGLFSSTKKGSATLGYGNGDLSVGRVSGNSSSRKQAATGSLGSVIDSLDQIASELDGNITGAGSVSIGVRKKSYRVDTTGQGRTKKGAGVVDFGADQEAAIRFAISEALKDGVIGGISDAAKNILTSGQKLETAIEKAVAIESIHKDLQARLNPLQAALDAVDDKFKQLAATLKEGGGSAEQIAEARQLWQLEREDTIKQIGDASKGLKEYLTSLKAGPNSPLSLRDQENVAQKQLQPFIDKINAGQAIDADAFREAADLFLSVERQINGSTQAYFTQFDKITSLTGSAINLIEKSAPVAGPGTDPFANLTAQATQTATAAQTTNTMLETTNALLGQVRDALGNQTITINGETYIASGRYFVKAK